MFQQYEGILVIFLNLPNSENNRLGRERREESKQIRIPKTADILAGEVICETCSKRQKVSKAFQTAKSRFQNTV